MKVSLAAAASLLVLGLANLPAEAQARSPRSQRV
jgi:hypothetical protein